MVVKNKPPENRVFSAGMYPAAEYANFKTDKSYFEGV